MLDPIRITEICTTGTLSTATTLWSRDPYQRATAPEWQEPPADPIADALKAAGQAAAQLADGAVRAARAVLGLVTDLDLSAPRVAVEDDEITIEWYKDRHYVAVVAVNGRSISWAIMAGNTNPVKGKAQFDNELPPQAYDAISIVAAA
jgi:hypothetical protein